MKKIKVGSVLVETKRNLQLTYVGLNEDKTRAKFVGGNNQQYSMSKQNLLNGLKEGRIMETTEPIEEDGSAAGGGAISGAGGGAGAGAAFGGTYDAPAFGKAPKSVIKKKPYTICAEEIKKNVIRPIVEQHLKKYF